MGITRENAKTFIGKWCLHDENRTGRYTKLFVSDIKKVQVGPAANGYDTLMIEYSYDKKRWHYADLSLFEHGDFIVSPFKEIETDDEAPRLVPSYDNSHSPYFWESVTRCANDQHDWTEADLMCWPPKKAHICKKCGIMKYDK